MINNSVKKNSYILEEQSTVILFDPMDQDFPLKRKEWIGKMHRVYASLIEKDGTSRRLIKIGTGFRDKSSLSFYLSVDNIHDSFKDLINNGRLLVVVKNPSLLKKCHKEKHTTQPKTFLFHLPDTDVLVRSYNNKNNEIIFNNINPTRFVLYFESTTNLNIQCAVAGKRIKLDQDFFFITSNRTNIKLYYKDSKFFVSSETNEICKPSQLHQVAKDKTSFAAVPLALWDNSQQGESNSVTSSKTTSILKSDAYFATENCNVIFLDPSNKNDESFLHLNHDWDKTLKSVYFPICGNNGKKSVIKLGSGFPSDSLNTFYLLVYTIRPQFEKYLTERKLLINVDNIELLNTWRKKQKEKQEEAKRKTNREKLASYNLIQFVIHNNGTATLEDLSRISGITDKPKLISKLDDLKIVGKRDIDGIIKYSK